MTIIRVAHGESSILTSTPFQQENELVDVLALHPSMFLAEGRHEVELVTRNLRLPDTGTIDLALVDRDGQPVLVEVKLARYAEPRREVVAQIFENVAAISDWTADDFDEASKGQLGHAVRSLVSDDQERAVRWRAIGQNLQEGRVRIVFAVDEMTPSLQQVIDFVGAHSDIQVNVLVVGRIADGEGNAIYDVALHAPKARKGRRPATTRASSTVSTTTPRTPTPARATTAPRTTAPRATTPPPTRTPNTTPNTTTATTKKSPANPAPSTRTGPSTTTRSTSTPSTSTPSTTTPSSATSNGSMATPSTSARLQAILDNLHDRLPENVTITGDDSTSRTLRVAGWPSGVAYEISDDKYQTVELHLADDDLDFLAPTLKEMAKSLGSFFTAASCGFDPDFGPDRGIIRLLHKPGTEARIVTQNVMTLIESTRGPITRLIKAGRSARV